MIVVVHSNTDNKTGMAIDETVLHKFPPNEPYIVRLNAMSQNLG